MREVIFHFVHSYPLALLAYCPARIALTTAPRFIKKTVVIAATAIFYIKLVSNLFRKPCIFCLLFIKIGSISKIGRYYRYKVKLIMKIIILLFYIKAVSSMHKTPWGLTNNASLKNAYKNLLMYLAQVYRLDALILV